MRNIGKIAVIALWCWDIIYIASGAVGFVFHIEWLSSLESGVAIIPACVLAALAVASVGFPKKKLALNYDREPFPTAMLRSTFD